MEALRARPRPEPSNSERRASAEAQDLRARRSRDALHQAMLALIEEKTFADITVDDIALKAGVGRATFYRHYATKDHLLEAIATAEIEQLVDLSLPLLSQTETRRGCLALCHHIDRHRALWSVLLTGGAASVMRETFIRLAHERGPAQLQQAESLIPADLGASCGVAATFEILAWWLKQSDPVAAEQIATYLDQLVVIPTLLAASGQPLEGRKPPF